MPRVKQHLKSLLTAYLVQFPDESARLQSLHHLLVHDSDPFVRSNMLGHITAGALILDPPARHLLLVWHKNLQRWVQPGGHVDAGEPIPNAALREAREETGLQQLNLHPWHSKHDGIPIDIDSHPIPANPRKGEGDHVHHDFRYLLCCENPAELVLAENEVTQYRWLPLERSAAAEISPGTVNFVSKVRSVAM